MSVSQLDGTLSAVVKEIAKLHGEILTAARTSLSKAIRIGELLSRVRASRKGKWLKWLDEKAPFTRQTACNYIRCFERRAELECKNVLHLSDAYAFLALPARTTRSTQRQSGSRCNVGGVPNTQHGEAAPAPTERPQPRRRHKSRHSIMDAISPENLERELRQSQIDIDKLFTDTLAQISRQDQAAWPDFPARLRTHGNALIEQGERLRMVK